MPIRRHGRGPWRSAFDQISTSAEYRRGACNVIGSRRQRRPYIQKPMRRFSAVISPIDRRLWPPAVDLVSTSVLRTVGHVMLAITWRSSALSHVKPMTGPRWPSGRGPYTPWPRLHPHVFYHRLGEKSSRLRSFRVVQLIVVHRRVTLRKD